MQQQQINHNKDLTRLQSEGFDITVDGVYLITRHLPYVNSKKEIKYGVLVCLLALYSPTKTGPPQDHTCFFCGETPCDITGKELTGLVNNSRKQFLTNTITADHYFSSRLSTGDYPDFYEKVNTYAKIIGSQAQALDFTVTWKPFKNNNNEK